MKTCPACGVENPDIARFCLACGTQLEEARPAQETRKVVTIVFSDLKGSTMLGEALDSEALREVMTRYFDAMRRELERHGGVIEKFIGDAVMAVFGLPRLHEDDALRAVRAAAGMQAALERLNEELESVYGVTLANRTGVNTGEVVAGDPATGQRLVTGDAVNVAARLEQAAGEKQVLLGALTYRLVRDRVDVEEVEPLTLKGKSERVPAYRLVGLREARDRELEWDAPLVGRQDELRVLHSAFEEAARSRSARLVTIVGDAGVGKSRLTAEFVSSLAGKALALEGRCLPYGDGITFWPLAEALRAESGITDEDDAAEARAKLAALTDGADDGVTDRIASAIGLSVEPFPVEELFWGVRRLLERRSAEAPVVFVVQDLHWAEPTLFALIEHLLESVDGALLIVGPARRELLQSNPSWGEGERSHMLVLDPLDAAATEAMIERLLPGGRLSATVLRRIVDAAEGNPLYAEHLLEMLTDDRALELRDGVWEATRNLDEIDVPPTIQALLASRLDLLAANERSVIEPASVIGYRFADAAVGALAPPEVSPDLHAMLASLTHKHLVRPHEDDDGVHRFDHIMVRDTAYDGILKRTRSDLHTRFVAWADVANQDRGVEFEEILGYHLEQAWRYLSELGPLDEAGRAVGEDGSRRLAAAGRRAFARGDIPGAVNLLGRAAALLPAEHPERLRLLPEHGEALLLTGRYAEAAAVLDEAIEGRGQRTAGARARLVRMLVRLRTGEAEGWRRETVDREIGAAKEVFELEGDDAGLAMAYRLLAWSAGTACRIGDAAEASALAMEHSRRAGDVRQELRAATAYAGAALLGPTNVDDAIARCEEALLRTTGNRQSEGNILAMLAALYAMQGTFDHARDLADRARALLAELGLDADVARADVEAWRVEMCAGELEPAETVLRRAHASLTSLGEKYLRSTVAGLLAQTLLERGASLEEAEKLGDECRELATPDDVYSQALWRCVRGRVLARRGLLDEAEDVLREALDVLEPTDATLFKLGAHLDHAEMLIAAGRPSEARQAYDAARELAETKGGVVMLADVLRRLEQLDAAVA
jgi:class 3 adenylate cyclase/tetratricopeptide (TPR) repeat protein